MKIPFTIEQFFDIFVIYNNAIWPAQIVAYILGIVAIGFAFSKNQYSARTISGIVSLFWIWIGVFYHIVFFRTINPAAIIFGFLYIIQGFLFLLAGSIRDRLSIQFKYTIPHILGAFFIFYAMVLYPILCLSFEHSYPEAPMFGVAPCPTTIFTFGILLWTIKKVPAYLLVIPFLWSIVGISAAINLRVPQDYGLVVAGFLGTILILIQNRIQSR
ncbi:MAG: DUF6064 family protein [Candidatus Latescibacterota bacterium]